MTPSKAIRRECAVCKGGPRAKCESRVCSLNHAGRPLPKIKAHCRECNGNDHPKECKGELLDGTTCNLHEFRLGKNPHAKKRTLSPEHRQKAIAALAEHRRKSCLSVPSTLPESTEIVPAVQGGGG